MNTPIDTADAGLVEAYLKPGEVYLSTYPTRVSTILGSCISVTLFHRSTGLGGICHAVMPEVQSESAETESGRYDPKYVDSAIRYLLSKISTAGIRFGDLEAKLFGGAAIMPAGCRACKDLSIGSQNVLMAKHVLKTSGVRISAADVGGIQGRKIVFLTHNGVVWLKRLKKSELKDFDILGPLKPVRRNVVQQWKG